MVHSLRRVHIWMYQWIAELPTFCPGDWADRVPLWGLGTTAGANSLQIK